MKYVSILIVVLLTLTVACSSSAPEKMAQKATEKMVEKAIQTQTGKDAKVDISKDSVKITSEDGGMELNAGDGAEIPADFPKDIFTYPKAKVAMSMTMPMGQTLALETSDAVDDVMKAYQKNMSEKGWKQSMSMNVDGQKMTTYNKESRVVQVVIGPQEGKTVINITAMNP